MNNLFKNLKSLKNIKPDADFAIHSRATILGTTKRPYYQILFKKQLQQAFSLSVAIGLTIVLLFSLGNLSRLRLNGFSPALISSLNSNDLAIEKQQLSFQIELAEAKYYKESTNQVTMALDNVFTNDPLKNSDSIKREAETIDQLIQKL